MPWTTPVRAGAVTDVGGGYVAWTGEANLVSLDGAASAEYFPGDDATIDTTDLAFRSWDITIPGGGAAVTRMKVSLEVRTTGFALPEMAVLMSMPFTTGTMNTTWGRGAGLFTSASWLLIEWDAPIGDWSLSASEIDTLISNDSAKGIDLEGRPNASVGDYCDLEIRNFTISFEYAEASGAGILLGDF